MEVPTDPGEALAVGLGPGEIGDGDLMGKTIGKPWENGDFMVISV